LGLGLGLGTRDSGLERADRYFQRRCSPQSPAPSPKVIIQVVMYTRRCMVFGLLAAALLRAQDAQQNSQPSLQVVGAVKQPLTLTADDLAKMPRATVHTTNSGMETVYEGVWLHEVLKRAGVPQGSELRGKALAGYVLAEAQDGYQVLFSLAELDPAFIDNEILLADTANGKPLFGAQGRFRLVVPKDKPGARSIRMLTKLEVVQLRK
jgi:DMSO/TMAO reductase YedYZ molybdopterin-dependent catalytic subunit